jgi:uncharacterized SAM-binding protein YcdF (DUF218 family)
MMATAAARQSRKRSRLWPVAIPVAALVVYYSITCTAILRAASLQQLHPADAIVVFGAAEYDGHPSPVLRARLDHAFQLYEDHLASLVIVSGGSGGDPNYTEGGVGTEYLMEKGIPESSLIAETQGDDTAESARRIAVIMRKNRLHTCIAVSDEYHVFRVRKLLEHQGLKVYLAPRPGSRPHSMFMRAEGVLREATSYLVWQLRIPT